MYNKCFDAHVPSFFFSMFSQENCWVVVGACPVLFKTAHQLCKVAVLLIFSPAVNGISGLSLSC